MKYMNYAGHIQGVAAVAEELEAHPGLWNIDTRRTLDEDSPHNEVDDIWLRFDQEALHGKATDVHSPHKSVWYDVADTLVLCRALVEAVAKDVKAKELGGVFITRIPPGKRVKPHVDESWHARYYEKVAVQIKGNLKQAFHFIGESFSPLPGDTYWFNNSHLHWVTNDSDEERITMIICIKRELR